MKTHAVSVREVGIIKEIRRSVIKIEGLANCMLGQLIRFSDGTKGFIMAFNEREVLALVLGVTEKIKAGDRVYSEVEPLQMPVGQNFVGRIITALAEPLDGKGSVKEDDIYDIFGEAPAVLDRVPIEEMILTGVRIIDSTFPIGKGQRELIIGDRMTGKTSIAIDTILNQKNRDIICIYCCIGRDYPSLEKVVTTLKQHDALGYVIIVSALASSPIGEQYLAPYVAATLGEYFMRMGRHALVVFDDLTKHAWAYRELSLLLENPPGREAYPGDIFYLHAQLMERAGKFSPELGGGSMTFLPIADTLQGDIAGFIPTNLISMTDGQIYLNATLFSEGLKPAIDLGLSVSRIGSRVQSAVMRDLTKDVGLQYIQHRELLKATRLKAGISEELSNRLRHGDKIEKIFIQERHRPSSAAEQLILFYALNQGVLDVLSDEQCTKFKRHIREFTEKNIPGLVRKLEKQELLTDHDKDRLDDCIVLFFQKLR